MSGRLEKYKETEQSIEKLLKKMPPIMEGYYLNLSAASKEPSTCASYLHRVYTMLRYFTTNPKTYDFSQLNEEMVSRFLTHIRTRKRNGTTEETSFAYRQMMWTVLNSLCKYLTRKKIIPENPMDYIDRPTNYDTVKRIRVTKEDIKAMIEGTNGDVINGQRISEVWKTRDRLVIVLLANTGIRREALCEIDIEDIDLAAKLLTVTDKRHKTRQYHLNDYTIQTITKWLEYRKTIVSSDLQTHALIISRLGERLNGQAIGEIIEKYSITYLGKRLTPHKLRSAFCSILYDETKDIEFVRDAVGHASTTTTQMYIVKGDNAQSQAADIMNNLFNDDYDVKEG